MDALKQTIGDYQSFLTKLLQEVVDEGFELSDFVQMDHLCYRVESTEQYESKKQELRSVGKLLGEAQINGRPIAVYRLNEPIYHDNWRIDTVELPAPKPGKVTKEGLEHVEFVLYDDKDAFLKKYNDKQFELQAADRGINPEIVFRLPSCTVKFHLLSLPAVVYLEHKLGMTDIHDGM